MSDPTMVDVKCFFWKQNPINILHLFSTNLSKLYILTRAFLLLKKLVEIVRIAYFQPTKTLISSTIDQKSFKDIVFSHTCYSLHLCRIVYSCLKKTVSRSYSIVQGVPRNITVARRRESRLSLWLYLWYSVVNLLSYVWFVEQNHKIIQVLTFPKCGLPFLSCQYYRRYLELYG